MKFSNNNNLPQGKVKQDSKEAMDSKMHIDESLDNSSQEPNPLKDYTIDSRLRADQAIAATASKFVPLPLKT